MPYSFEIWPLKHGVDNRAVSRKGDQVVVLPMDMMLQEMQPGRLEAQATVIRRIFRAFAAIVSHCVV